MNKILLCGNGINIEFNKEFCFKNFIDILTNEEKLLELINEILEKLEYKEFDSFKEDFLEIFDKCKSSIINLDQESKFNGVEIAVSAFKRSVKALIFQSPLNIKNENLNKFEHFFDLLFFYFLANLQKKSKINLLKNSKWNINFKKYLKEKEYQYIYTLNYDSLLTTIYKESYIWHVHGKLKFENNKLDYKGCVFESYLNPKWNSLRKTTLPIFLDMNELKGEYNLDVVGLNSKNDEEIFIFFIFSQICKTITYYFHNENDLKNFHEFLEMIANWNEESEGIELIKEKDFLKINLNEDYPDYNKKIEITEDQAKLNYNIKFLERTNPSSENWKIVHKLKIKLRESKDFWDEVNKKEIILIDNKEELQNEKG